MSNLIYKNLENMLEIRWNKKETIHISDDEDLYLSILGISFPFEGGEPGLPSLYVHKQIS